MFYKIGVLKNFAKFTGKSLCWSLFSNKVQALGSTQVLPCIFCEIFKNTFFYRKPPVVASVNQNQRFTDVKQESCSVRFCKVHMKKNALGSLF